MIHFILLFSRQGKIRLQKWYEARLEREKRKVTRELTQVILARKPKMSNFLEWKGLQIVYKRYASLFFCFAIDKVSCVTRKVTLKTMTMLMMMLMTTGAYACWRGLNHNLFN